MRVALGGLLLLLMVGCGPAKAPTAPVSGLVTYHGKALTRGRVVFIHDSGKFGEGDISSDGHYKVDAPLGECKVSITCREDPPTDPAPGFIILKSFIPEKFENHMESGLKFDVQEKDNIADWKLQ